MRRPPHRQAIVPGDAVAESPAPNTAPAAPVTAENEFDSTWTK
jgi:hypothetical protein